MNFSSTGQNRRVNLPFGFMTRAFSRQKGEGGKTVQRYIWRLFADVVKGAPLTPREPWKIGRGPFSHARHRIYRVSIQIETVMTLVEWTPPGVAARHAHTVDEVEQWWRRGKGRERCLMPQFLVVRPETMPKHRVIDAGGGYGAVAWRPFRPVAVPLEFDADKDDWVIYDFDAPPMPPGQLVGEISKPGAVYRGSHFGL